MLNVSSEPVGELLCRLAEQVVNAVMDAEADQLCGGGAISRNGYRERGLATCVVTLTPRIPKLRSGSEAEARKMIESGLELADRCVWQGLFEQFGPVNLNNSAANASFL